MRELAYVSRALLKAPAFTGTAVTTLGLGVAISVASYSLVDWLRVRPVPGVRDGRRVAVVWFGGRAEGGMVHRSPVTTSQAQELDRSLPVAEGLAGYSRFEVSVANQGKAQRVEAEAVMPAYLRLLGTRPELGRLLNEEDDIAPIGSRVAVIGHELWRDLFDEDPAVLGTSLRVNAEPFTVVGVAEPGFQGADRQASVRLWIPGRSSLSLRLAGRERGPAEPVYGEFVTRLAEGASFGQLEEQLGVASSNLLDQRPIVFRGVGVSPVVRRTVHEISRLLVVFSGLVLLTAGANAANLVVVRGLIRGPYLAMRRVLGATAWVLVRQQLLEAVVLGVLAAIVGLVLGEWILVAFRGLRLSPFGMPVPHVPLNWRVGVFAAGAAVATATLAAWVPAVTASRTSAMEAVKAGAGTYTPERRWRTVFAAVQVSLSISLLVGAQLLLITLRNLARVDLGFDAAGVSAAFVAPRDQGYEGARLRLYYAELLRRAREAHGVESAALAFSFPLSPFSTSMMVPVQSDGADPGAAPTLAVLNRVSPDYFRTLGIPLLAGRTFTDEEFLAGESRPLHVVIISESLARKFFGGGNPISGSIGLDRSYEVVGVVGDTHWRAFEGSRELGSALAAVYLPFTGAGIGVAALVVRSQGEAGAISVIRSVFKELDSSLPVYGETTLADAARQYLSDRLVFSRLFLFLSALSTALTGVGLYGVVSYATTARWKEIGIMMAFGAPPTRIVGSVVLQGAAPLGIGAVFGIGGAILVGTLLRSRLYGVDVWNPLPIVLALAILAGVAALASWLPASAAARGDPTAALRAE